ncbi:MAG: type II CRISPR RNA-guided endonuclease Cas9 [Planctomycetota bacterium]
MNNSSQIALSAPYILGLDAGVGSIGWAMLNADSKSILRTGVRVFEAGVEGDIESGRDESRNLKRRQMRLQRRNLWRRARRLRKIFRLLQRATLLPAGEIKTPQQRDELLKNLDRELLALATHANHANLLPYHLRARALDHQLDPREFGRALYHLAQRRGFLSNRKEAAKPDEKLGKVKQGIGEIWEGMKTKNARTLGEYFAGLDPQQRRIRQRWTAHTTTGGIGDQRRFEVQSYCQAHRLAQRLRV